MQQLELFDANLKPAVDAVAVDIARIEAHLAAVTGEEIVVRVTDNRRSMLSWGKLRNGRRQLRMHHMFLRAPAEVIAAVGGMVISPRASRAAVQAYIRAHHQLIKPATPCPQRQIRLQPVGAFFDLRDIHRDVNARFFGGKSKAAVTWGGPVSRGRVRCVQFGSYNEKTNVIRLSRRLNAKDIPRYMLEFVMYHEILHELLGVKSGPGGRRQVHTREFRELERAFPDYDKVRAFKKKRWRVR
jgi:hypothetical protein